MFEKTKNWLVSYLDAHTRRLFDVDDGKLKDVPNVVIWLVYIMCMSVLIQGIADVVLKVGGFTPLLVKLPWRMDFLFLTLISVVMGYQALKGMRRRELDVTRNSVQIGVLVEIGLVVGDIYFIAQNIADYPGVLWIRMPFMVLTTFNVFIFIYIIQRLDLFKDKKGNWRCF